MRHVSCDLCGADDPRFLFYGLDRVFRRDRDWRIVRCRRCGLMYLDPRPGPEEVAPYYEGDYYAFHAPAADGWRGRVREGVVRRWRGLSPRFGPTAWAAGLYRHHLRGFPDARPAGRLLDVGCGAGEAMRILKDAGWSVAGIESSAEAAARARDEGLDVRAGSVEDADLPLASFDWVRLSHCLEHLESPRRALERMRGTLVPGGRMILTLPDCGGWPARALGRHWLHWEIGQHLTFFTERTLRRMLASAGLEVVRVRRYFLPHRFLAGLWLKMGLRWPFPVGLPVIGGAFAEGFSLSDELVVLARRSGGGKVPSPSVPARRAAP
ncbi:MAG: class I SAM-dependent methyltransferase [Planctomycetes bacterium]|nr:class I SAM-dependent methyltransferase [Planctomycetota bacterium]